MAQTRDLGSFFWHPIPLRTDAPRWHWATTHEVEEPFRVSRSLVLRIWGEHGVVLGRWKVTERQEEEALLAALGREMDEATPDDIEDWDGPNR